MITAISNQTRSRCRGFSPFAWLLLSPCLAFADVQPPVESQPVQTVTAANLAESSDIELTALTARWAELAPDERRVLLAEVRNRMARNNPTRQPKVTIRVQRRYGRVVRQPDGSVVVETRVVEMRPRTEGGRATFGVGFEQRSKRGEGKPQQPAVQEGKTPTVTVSQQPNEKP